MLSAPGPLNESLVAAAMTDTASRGVLMACVLQARSAKDISVHTGIPLTTVYRQVHKLEGLGILVVERSALTEDGRKYDMYRSRVEAVHLRVDDDGDHITWRPNPAVERRIEHTRLAAG